jgi:hypothetical protein
MDAHLPAVSPVVRIPVGSRANRQSVRVTIPSDGRRQAGDGAC